METDPAYAAQQTANSLVWRVKNPGKYALSQAKYNAKRINDTNEKREAEIQSRLTEQMGEDPSLVLPATLAKRFENVRAENGLRLKAAIQKKTFVGYIGRSARISKNVYQEARRFLVEDPCPTYSVPVASVTKANGKLHKFHRNITAD